MHIKIYVFWGGEFKSGISFSFWSLGGRLKLPLTSPQRLKLVFFASCIGIKIKGFFVWEVQIWNQFFIWISRRSSKMTADLSPEVKTQNLQNTYLSICMRQIMIFGFVLWCEVRGHFRYPLRGQYEKLMPFLNSSPLKETYIWENIHTDMSWKICKIHKLW